LDDYKHGILLVYTCSAENDMTTIRSKCNFRYCTCNTCNTPT